jgi:hypothetical protein
MGLEPATTMPHADPTDPGRPGTPMDAHDRYLLPDPSGEREGLVPFTRASTVKARAQKGESLKTWNEIMLAKGLGIAPDLVALVASTPLGAPGSRDILLDAVEQAKVRAGARASANLGSALHAFTEQVDKGEPLADVLERVPDALKADVQAYADMLVRYGLTPVPELVERIVVNLKLQTGLTWEGKPGTRRDAAAGVAARFDRMYRWTDAEGHTWLIPGDLKTGKNAVAYGALETCVQEAIAANADLLWNEESEAYEDMPGDSVHDGGQLRLDFGLLIHLPVGTGTCEPEALDLELGWRLAKLAVELMIIDKAKDHCHWPFSAQVFPQRFVQAPEDAPTLREADVDEAPAPEPKRVEIKGGRKPEDGVAADGSPLQPLARDVPGRRGCSACGRVGHRKGSPACWGDTDPAKLAPAPEPATVPVPDGVIACGPDGAVTELTEDDAATVQAFADQLQNMAEAEESASAAADNGTDAAEPMETIPAPTSDAPPCAHSKGYTRGWARYDEAGVFHLQPAEPGEDAPWLCGKCGQESPRAAEARLARAAMDSPGPRPAMDVNPDGQDEAQGDAEDEAELDALLADPEPESPEEAVHRFIREAQSRADLQAVRKGALREGTWTDAHTKAGLARLKELTS